MPRKLRLIRGARYGCLRDVAGSDWELDREMKDAFVAMYGEDGSVPSEAIYDIRRGRQAPWRVLARRIREARAMGVPKEQVHAVVHVLEGYVESVYAKSEKLRPAA